MERKQVLAVATEVGYMMLKYGGEVYRAEQCARYICQYYEIPQVDVFAIPNSIVVTITDGEDYITKTRRVTGSQVDLTKIDRINALSRKIGEGKLSYEEIFEEIREINSLVPYSLPVQIFGAAMVCLGFSMLFGATYLEGIISAIAGGLGMGVLGLLGSRGANNFIKTASCSLIITVIANVAKMALGNHIHLDPIITGALMILVPGLAFTNCMRDLMANDYVSGVTRFTEAVMTALATALGVAVVLLVTAQM